MRPSSVRLSLVVLSLCWTICCLAQTADPAAEESLREFLQRYLSSSPPDEWDKSTRYQSVFVDLNDDGIQEVMVYVVGRGWCGTGGCPTLILARQDSSYRVVTKTTIAQLPIRLLANRSHGWRSISVVVSGGGIQPGYDAELRFDGKTYPTNPSMPPARELPPNAPGEVVISSATQEKALYP